MFERDNETSADAALRAGLAGLPYPEPSPDFSAHILVKLRRQPTKRIDFWSWTGSLCAPAVGALVVMLLLIHWTMQQPFPMPAQRTGVHSTQEALNHMLQTRPLSADALQLSRELFAPDPAPVKTDPENEKKTRPGRRSDRGAHSRA